ncbi:hypothetical protein ET445_05100 [Agromyces protaetiae]|uniref:Uncharacterized protein n=1 Tax=Agromyces protaetiae TaxID=2509455 RepID=A0A4P6FA41_9MICO|nr:hypothetical protein [Agromyces protaetiae]QAY72812.1 hypothetical protein ET445_05100 [Agromyces protaetiae]
MPFFPRRGRPSDAEADAGRLRAVFFERHPGFDALPPIAGRLEDVARAVGLPQSFLDREAVEGRLRDTFRALAVEAGLRVGDRGVGDRLARVLAAGDPLSDDALWDAFFAGGARTVAGAGPVARACADGRLVEVTVSALRREQLLGGADASATQTGEAERAASAPRDAHDGDRARLRDLLDAAGFERVNADRYHGAFRTPGESTRPLWVDLGASLTVFAPFAEYEGHTIPDRYHDLHGGRYDIEGHAPFAVLTVELPWEIEESTFRHEARAIALQAEAWRRHHVPRRRPD